MSATSSGTLVHAAMFVVDDPLLLPFNVSSAHPRGNDFGEGAGSPLILVRVPLLSWVSQSHITVITQRYKKLSCCAFRTHFLI